MLFNLLWSCTTSYAGADPELIGTHCKWPETAVMSCTWEGGEERSSLCLARGEGVVFRTGPEGAESLTVGPTPRHWQFEGGAQVTYKDHDNTVQIGSSGTETWVNVNGIQRNCMQDEEPFIWKLERLEGQLDPVASTSLEESCGNPTVLLSQYPYETLQKDYCSLCGDHDEFACVQGWPTNDVPSCFLYDGMRNGLYARYGYAFSTPEWQAWIGEADWYTANPDYDEAKLSPVARANGKHLKSLAVAGETCSPVTDKPSDMQLYKAAGL
jgi:hypothetical protein